MPSKRDLLSITDITPGETSHIIRRALQMKAEESGAPLLGKEVRPAVREAVPADSGQL